MAEEKAGKIATLRTWDIRRNVATYFTLHLTPFLPPLARSLSLSFSVLKYKHHSNKLKNNTHHNLN